MYLSRPQSPILHTWWIIHKFEARLVLVQKSVKKRGTDQKRDASNTKCGIHVFLPGYTDGQKKIKLESEIDL